MAVEVNKEGIIKRLREFGDSNFKNYKIYAENIGITYSTLLGTYFSGKSLPGAPLLYKLAKLGCDINWLLTGEIKDKSGMSLHGNNAGMNIQTQGDNPNIKVNAGNQEEIQSLKNTIVELTTENLELKKQVKTLSK